MTLTITVQTHIGPDIGMSQTEQVADALAAIGFIRGDSIVLEPLPMPAPSVSSVSSGEATEGDRVSGEKQPSVLDEPSVQKAVQRERGKPAPGKKRRTAEEVAEDEAAEKTAAETQAIVHDVAADAKQTELEGAIAAKPQISSGEARVGPEDEPEADQIQDIADEHAEVAAAAPAAAPATLDDVRGVVGDYVTAFGMPATQADIAKVLESVLGPTPPDLTDTKGQPTKVWPIAKVPESRFADVVAACKKALLDNPFSRDRVS